MDKIMPALFIALLLVNPVFAGFNSEIAVLEKVDVVKLSDEKLVDAYMDVLVEIEAIKTFHVTSGFTPKQYDALKDLLKYRLRLLMEIHSRNVELPQQMER